MRTNHIVNRLVAEWEGRVFADVAADPGIAGKAFLVATLRCGSSNRGIVTSRRVGLRIHHIIGAIERATPTTDVKNDVGRGNLRQHFGDIWLEQDSILYRAIEDNCEVILASRTTRVEDA